MNRKNVPVKNLSLILSALLITACSVNSPVSLQEKNVGPGLTVEESRQLEQEYSAFKIKDLTASYLLRKLEKWLSIPNENALVKELLYAEAKGETAVPISEVVNEDLCDAINGTPAVNTAKEARPSFKAFMNNLCPPLAPVEGRILFSDNNQHFSTMDSNGKNIKALVDQNGGRLFNVGFTPDATKLYAINASNFLKMDPDGTNIASIFDFTSFTYTNVNENIPYYIQSYLVPLQGILPDESKVAFVASAFDPPVDSEEQIDPEGKQAADIFVMNAGNPIAVNLTVSTNRFEEFIGWFANGTKILYRTYNENLTYCDPDICEPPPPVRVQNIYSINVDGSSPANLTNFIIDGTEVRNAVMSADGSKVAFDKDDGAGATRTHSAFIVKSDGSGMIDLKDHIPAGAITSFDQLKFTADGSKLIFTGTSSSGNTDLFIINSDGSNFLQLTDSPANKSAFQALPGGKIAFIESTFIPHSTSTADIIIINEDGSEPVNITAATDLQPDSFSYSPSGSRLVFGARTTDNFRPDIYRINSDGTELTNLTKTSGLPEVLMAWK
jgi:Tol biopolymer transport system component